MSWQVEILMSPVTVFPSSVGGHSRAKRSDREWIPLESVFSLCAVELRVSTS